MTQTPKGQYEEIVINDKKIFICLIPGCAKRFKFQSEIKRHLTNHSEQRPFTCAFPDCGKSFKRPDALSNHFRTHSKKSLFECPFPDCGSQFTTNSSLKYHLLKHQKENSDNCLNLDIKSFLDIVQSQREDKTDLNDNIIDLMNSNIDSSIFQTLKNQKQNDDYFGNSTSNDFNNHLFDINANKPHEENIFRNEFEGKSLKSIAPPQTSIYEKSKSSQKYETSSQSLLKKNPREMLKNMMDMMTTENNNIKDKLKFPPDMSNHFFENY